MVGKWQAQHECCFVIRASDEFANGVDKGDDVYDMLAVASGRYYKVKPSEMIFRQEPSDGECNAQQLFIWPTTEGGHYVSHAPGDGTLNKKDEDAVLLWINGDGDTGPNGKIHFPHYASKKKCRLSQDISLNDSLKICGCTNWWCGGRMGWGWRVVWCGGGVSYR